MCIVNGRGGWAFERGLGFDQILFFELVVVSRWWSIQRCVGGGTRSPFSCKTFHCILSLSMCELARWSFNFKQKHSRLWGRLVGEEDEKVICHFLTLLECCTSFSLFSDYDLPWYDLYSWLGVKCQESIRFMVLINTGKEELFLLLLEINCMIHYNEEKNYIWERSIEKDQNVYVEWVHVTSCRGVMETGELR